MRFITNGGSVIVCPGCLEEAGFSLEYVVSGVANPNKQTMSPVLNNNVVVIDY